VSAPPADATRLRRDAARNRDAILAAARDLLGSGRDVPMYEIGRRAGVGQATLYRHFPDRSALVAAIAREHIERIETIAAESEDDERAILVVLDASAEMLVAIHELIGVLREDATLAPILDELRRRMLAVLASTLDRSRGSDLVRSELAADDLMLVLKMINGALVGVSTTAERTEAAARALDVALNGLLAQPRRTAPSASTLRA
jgi:AcrR family transcriptional regulator